MLQQGRTSFRILILTIVSIITLGSLFIFPKIAQNSFGPPDINLSLWQRFRYSLELIAYSSDLTEPASLDQAKKLFNIKSGEGANTIAINLEGAGLISNSRIFGIYLAWSGKDVSLQTGTFRLSPSLSAIEIAEILEAPSSTEVSISIWPGWRIEEIAANIPTSGLTISPDTFIKAGYSILAFPDLIPSGISAEGYLFPGTYLLSRTTTVDQFFEILIQGFRAQITDEYMRAFDSQGLSLHQAITLASIIQREAMVESEMRTISSVFYNRLSIGMMLQADPTIQYALGYNQLQKSWWVTPLTLSDLVFNSPYNTYLFPGLPPGPICNPGLSAIEAVAFPELTSYYYFQAKCDGSGYHNFANTLDQHIANNCP